MAEVADYVRHCRTRGDDIVLVLSAMGSETDDLLRLATDISSDPSGREMDMLITAGERKAIALMCMALHVVGVEAESFTGSQAGLVTDTNHRNAKILSIAPKRILASLAEGKVPVVAGAQGVSTDSDVTFLGRGGSDTTAVALAHELGAEVCELFTDVSGVFTTDPRICSKAHRIATLTFDELLEMTAMGCPKPTARSVEVARAYDMRLHVRSAFTWEPGTWVLKPDDNIQHLSSLLPDLIADSLPADSASTDSLAKEQDGAMEQAIIKGVVPDTSQAKITITGVKDEPGIAGVVFRTLADSQINVDMIVQSASANGEADISFTVPQESAEQARQTCEAMSDRLAFKSVVSDTAIGRVSVVGAGMATHPGVAATMFETLAAQNINIDMIATSPIRISCVVAEEQTEQATIALHTAYGLDQ